MIIGEKIAGTALAKGPSFFSNGQTPPGCSRRHLTDGDALVVGRQKAVHKGKESFGPEPFEGEGQEPPVLPDPSGENHFV